MANPVTAGFPLAEGGELIVQPCFYIECVSWNYKPLGNGGFQGSDAAKGIFPCLCCGAAIYCSEECLASAAQAHGGLECELLKALLQK